MKRINNNVWWFLLLISGIAAFFYCNSQFTFGFLPLFIALCFFMCIPILTKSRRNQESEEEPDQDLYSLVKSVFLIIVFGALALYSLGNYFNPKSEIYSNYQHHAIKVEGVKAGSDNFLLAGNSQNAFFDSRDIMGTVRITGYDTTSVNLSFHGFGNPFYKKNNTKIHTNLNEGLISFMTGDSVELVSNEKDNNGHYRRLSFKVEDLYEKGGLFKRPKSRSKFIFNEEGVTDTSSFEKYLILGYSFEGITADVPLQMDIRGINVVRGNIKIDVKRRNIQREYGNRPYYLEIEPEANLRSVIVNGAETMISSLKSYNFDVDVPYDTAFYIGLGKHTTEAFKFRRGKEGELLLCYEMPKYHSLTASGESGTVNLMVTTSIISDENVSDSSSGLLDNLTDNVLQFDLFHKTSSNFNFEPFFISYLTGQTNETMQFTLLTPATGTYTRDIKAGEYFPGIHSTNGTEWLVQVENFRDTTPFQATTLSWILLIVILLSAVSIIISIIVSLNIGTSIYVAIEYAAYLLTIAFLTIRFFLLWRVTVFPPTTLISKFEFFNLRDSKWLYITVVGIVFFFIVINTVKFFVSVRIQGKTRTREHKNKLRDKSKTHRHKKKAQDRLWQNYPLQCVGILMIITYIVILVIGKAVEKPLFTVLVPPCFYLAADCFIYWKFGKPYTSRYNKRDDSVQRSGMLLLSILNMLIATAVTFWLDGGFGVMFTMFALFALWLKINDIYQYTESSFKNYKENHVRFAQVTILFTLLPLTICYKRIFLYIVKCFLPNSDFLDILILAISAALILFIFVMCILIILDIPFRKAIAWSAGTGTLCLTATLIVCFLFSGKITGSHMEFRARVHMEKAEDIMSQIETPEQQNKFLQASLNDWILYEYNDIGKDVNTFGENGTGYFKIQPQSKLGAMWFAQTTDICLARFIIAEHGKLLAESFIVVFLILLLIVLIVPSNTRWTRVTSIQIALILTVQALMVFLANTRAFLFFGQDFPLVSVTSKVSPTYYFVLMASAVALCIIGVYQFNHELSDNNFKKAEIERENHNIFKNILLLFSGIAISLIIQVTNLNVKPEKGKENKSASNIEHLNSDDTDNYFCFQDRTYNIDILLAQMNQDFERFLNPAFTEYQKNNGVPILKKNMSDFVSKALSDSTTCLSDSVWERCSQFTRRMVSQFKSTGSKNNSRDNLVYLQYRRTYDSKYRSHDTLEFRVRNEFFKYELPTKAKDQWRGSIIERPTSGLPADGYVDETHEGYSYAYIPASYSANGKPVQLLKVFGNKELAVVSSDAMLMARASHGALNIGAMDYIMNGNHILEDAPLKRLDYIARRLLLNGRWTFIYPHGHQMLWARNESARLQKKHKADDSDIYLSISSELTADIYDAYKAHSTATAADKTVIVADGDGYIRAMVDYRTDRNYRINPNDARRIAEVTDSLYMYGERGRAAETRYFGNFAKDYLRRGPGSSQKPILWTAVTTMYNTGWWKDLEFAGVPYDQYIESSIRSNDGDHKENYKFTKYAGYGIEKKNGFQSLISDEGNGSPVGLQFYMYKSSNYYNSLVAYIGAFNKEELQKDEFMQIADNRNHSTLFRTSPRIVPPQRRDTHEGITREKERYLDEYIDQFPQVNIGTSNRKRRLLFNKFITYEMALDTNALAPHGLSENFGLSTVRDWNSQDPSYYNIGVREGRTANRQLNEYVVRSVAIGSNTIWQVSPWKMTEMYGRLASMNSNYSLTMEEPLTHDPAKYEMMTLDDSYNAQNTTTKYDNYLDARKELLIGMSKVYEENVGTAGSLKLNRVAISSGQTLSLDLNDGTVHDFYVYGKTGTINGIWGDATYKQDHLLATIITNRKLSSATADELADLKFYVIYQADFDYANAGISWYQIDKEVIQAVVRSDAFQIYMGLK